MPAPTISDDLRADALAYHRQPRPGKLEVQPSKPLGNQRDLALAYTPGVAAVCQAIAADPAEAATLTARQNLVAVVSNGTAVLGLGDIGPLASKPVMEGKAVLFKKFAGIDVFDLEIASKPVDEIVTVVSALEPTFGGINLEDIKAPECFEVERRLRERMRIPVFHDDQHGTAIIVGAAVRNALELTGKRLDAVKIVTSGAGAAALACLKLLVEGGAKRENIWVSDIEGVVWRGRPTLMDPWKEPYAQETDARTLSEIIDGADIFLGLSAGGVLTPGMVARMAPRPLIMALANPFPEIMPDEARKARPDALICTGRSDFPNQVNNVLCFPYMFRGALDVGATEINEAMKLAAVEAIAGLARETPSDVVAQAYGGEARGFGPDSLIPTPFDPRLILRIAPAVARAAMETGVAARPIEDFEAYGETLARFVFRSGFIMKPLFTAARENPRRVVFAEGEDERVLRAAQILVEEGLARPILIGRPRIIEARRRRCGLTLERHQDYEVIDPADDPRYREYWTLFHELAGRRGVTPDAARTIVRSNTTVIACLALHRGDADAMICGLEGGFMRHLANVRTIIGLAPGVRDFSALSAVIVSRGVFFICDTQVKPEPSAEEVAEMAWLASEHVRRFGLVPKVALLSHADFGSYDTASARKMRCALDMIASAHPELEVDGEMQADTALSESVRELKLSGSRLTGEANVLVMPNLDAANIAYQMARMLADALPIGPILMGAAKPAHIMTRSSSVRGIVNMAAVAVAEAQALEAHGRAA